MHFESTVSIGNLLTFLGLLLAAYGWWRAHESSESAKLAYQRDMDWRVKNLENWRKEHMIDADARDELLQAMGGILRHIKWQTEFMWSKQTGQHVSPPPVGDD